MLLKCDIPFLFPSKLVFVNLQSTMSFFQYPTVVGYYLDIPLTQITLSLLLTDYQDSPESWPSGSVQNEPSHYVAAQLPELFKHISHNLFIVCFFFLQKASYKFESFPGLFFIFFQFSLTIFVFYKLSYIGPSKNTLLQLWYG